MTGIAKLTSPGWLPMQAAGEVKGIDDEGSSADQVPINPSLNWNELKADWLDAFSPALKDCMVAGSAEADENSCSDNSFNRTLPVLLSFTTCCTAVPRQVS